MILQYEQLAKTIEASQHLIYKNEVTKKICGALYQTLFAIDKTKPGYLRKSRKQHLRQSNHIAETLQTISAIRDRVTDTKKYQAYKIFERIFNKYYDQYDLGTLSGRANYNRIIESFRELKDSIKQGISADDHMLIDVGQDHIFGAMNSQQIQLHYITKAFQHIRENKIYFKSLEHHSIQIKDMLENIEDYINQAIEEHNKSYQL